MYTTRKPPFIFRPHFQLFLIALASFIWGRYFASRGALLTDDLAHWFWPNAYGYMTAFALAEAVIYGVMARWLFWPWLSRFHVATMWIFAGVMWAFEMAGDVPCAPALPVSHTMLCLSEYLLLAGHLAFFTHLSAGVIMGGKAAV